MLVIEKGDKAKQLVKKFIELHNDSFTQQWLEETYPVFCIIKYDNAKTHPICIALLHKIDFDSFHIFDKPVLLDYIYTMIKYRKNGFASNLIHKIINKNQIIGFCCNDESTRLFVKNGFSYHPDKQWMVRYPPLIYNIEPLKNPIEQFIRNEEGKHQKLLEEPDKNFEKYVSNLLLNEFKKNVK